MLLFARIEVSSASKTSVDLALQAQHDGADWLHVVDIDADAAGAPQNIQIVHQILLACALPVQFRGGVDLVHTAELVLGLGAKRVVIDSGLRKTERSPAHFFSRLGEGCVAAIADLVEVPVLVREGCRRVLYDGPAMSATLDIPIIAGSERNLTDGDSVSFEGVVVAPSRLSALARERECSKR